MTPPSDRILMKEKLSFYHLSLESIALDYFFLIKGNLTPKAPQSLIDFFMKT
jgi:hypothetical protein